MHKTRIFLNPYFMLTGSITKHLIVKMGEGMLRQFLKLSGDSWFFKRNFVFFRRIAKKIAT